MVGMDFVIPAGFETQFEKIMAVAKKHNGLVKITIEPMTNTRRKDINAKFHAMCGDLVRSSGGSKDYFKEWAKTFAVEHLGYPAKENEFGEVEKNEHGIVGMSSSKATEKQFDLLIEALRIIPADFGQFLEE